MNVVSQASPKTSKARRYSPGEREKVEEAGLKRSEGKDEDEKIDPEDRPDTLADKGKVESVEGADGQRGLSGGEV